MFEFLKKPAYSIGIDMGDDNLSLIQLAQKSNETILLAGSSESRPGYIEAGTVQWQRWAIDAIKGIVGKTKFSGKNTVAAIPPTEVFIDHIKMPSVKNGQKTHDAILTKIKPKLPFDAADALLKFIPTEEDNCMVIATDRTKVDRHLAIFEKAGLQIKSLSVWPDALARSYIKFFGRRRNDLDAVVLLIDIGPNCTNMVICRHKNLLFAKSFPIGAAYTEKQHDTERLILEIDNSVRHFSSMYKKARIERMIFLSGKTVDVAIYTSIAKKLDMPAQLGDCMAAIRIPDPENMGVDRRGCNFSWATAFGLSLS
ncbi:MAG: pilus assembly protein PilM [Phycisphaerae bacterium]|nr:pilus assembly protein PilM [Phycisphaerae bacterium]